MVVMGGVAADWLTSRASSSTTEVPATAVPVGTATA